MVGFAFRIGVAIPKSEIYTVVEGTFNILFLPFWVFVDKRLVLCVCHFVGVHVERIQIDGMYWTFVGLPGLTAHLKFTCRY